MAFENRKLYGGAMVVGVPKKYYDVSSLRQVPDTQEVYQEREGMNNVIFDILEYVQDIEDPIEAARFHLEDYADGDGDLTVYNTEETNLALLSGDVSAVSLLATTPPQDNKSNAIFLLLVRLEKHATDILITINMLGVSTGGAAEYDALFKETADAGFREGREILQHVIETFEIKDYKLFHPQEVESATSAK